MEVTHRPLADLLAGAAGWHAAGVTVWHCPVGGPVPDDTLTADESARAARYRSPAAREQFTACRASLRLVLSRILGRDPAAVQIAVEPDGKPYVPGRPVEFNVSHTAGLALVAVAPVPVGVDVERVRVVANAAGLVARYFTPDEQAEFAGLPEELRPAAFLRGWTGKEAVLKGIGCGVRGLERCRVRLDPRLPAEALAPPGWRLAEWAPTLGTVAALAVTEA